MKVDELLLIRRSIGLFLHKSCHSLWYCYPPKLERGIVPSIVPLKYKGELQIVQEIVVAEQDAQLGLQVLQILLCDVSM